MQIRLFVSAKGCTPVGPYMTVNQIEHNNTNLRVKNYLASLQTESLVVYIYILYSEVSLIMFRRTYLPKQAYIGLQSHSPVLPFPFPLVQPCQKQVHCIKWEYETVNVNPLALFYASHSAIGLFERGLAIPLVQV